MRTLHLVGLMTLLGAGGCYPGYVADSTTPMAAEPVAVAGPPGGGIDPGYGYEAEGQPGYPAGYPSGYPNGYPPGAEYGTGADPGAQQVQDPYAEPQAQPDPMGTVTDAEIDQTLQPYGQWVVEEDYGRVWRPDTTVVGVNFTPYETCGSWVTTEYGPTFSCDYDWGWLPFHYGQWEWFDSYWGWCPDYVWSPAWVEWRSGGGYVGWRPQGPHIRDHRGGKGPIVRDHRRPRHDSHWRFATQADFGKRNIHAHTFQNTAEGLRLTNEVVRPTVRPTTTVNAANLMRGRLAGRTAQDPTRQPNVRQPNVRNDPRAARWQPTPRGSNQQPGQTYTPPARTTQPYPPARGTYQPPRTGTTYTPPTRGTYQPPARTYQPPSRQTYQPPARTYQPPSRGTYTPPSRGTYTPPTRTYTPPSRSYSPPTYSPPSRSSGSSSPSHSSSSSSSGSHSSPSHSSSSSSSSHSSSSSSSHSSGGGSHHR